ncbi:acyl carrier protein [Amycolatopsis sp. NPDC059027]|uniref:acyl carrier protein n=1 Tax=unclassified Amycolatopsis TaxID=2618356 RepID=UPI003672037D
MPVTSDLDRTIEKYATGRFTDATPLLEAGIESLALLRLAVEVVSDEDAEIDLADLVDVRTIGDLKAWLTRLAATAC